MNHGVFGNASLGYGRPLCRKPLAELVQRCAKAQPAGPEQRREPAVPRRTSSAFPPEAVVAVAEVAGGTARTTSSLGASRASTLPMPSASIIATRFGKTKVTGSYFFNQQRSINTSNSERTTFLSDTSAQVTNSADGFKRPIISTIASASASRPSSTARTRSSSHRILTSGIPRTMRNCPTCSMPIACN